MDTSSDILSPTYSGPSFPSCLLCYLCGELFRRPRILPCGHTFCSECLAKIKDEIVGGGQSLSSTTVSSHSEHQLTSDNYTDPLSPERSVAVGLKVKSSERDEVHFVNGTTFDEFDGNRGSAVDRVGSAANSRHSCSFSVKSDAVVLRNNSSTAQARRPLIKSDTYTVDKMVTCSERDRTPSRLCSEPSPAPCSRCGHITPPPRRRSPASRSLSFKEKSANKSQGNGSKGPRWDNSPQRKTLSAMSPPACSFDQKHGKEMELFFCPIPDCSYSMRVMNLSRWSPRNKAVADAVAAWKHMHAFSTDGSTQTEISHNQSLLVTLPRALVSDKPLVPLGSRKRHSSMMDMAVDHGIGLDGLQRGYLPRGHFTWRSYAAMVGMNILHQLVNL